MIEKLNLIISIKTDRLTVGIKMLCMPDALLHSTTTTIPAARTCAEQKMIASSTATSALVRCDLFRNWFLRSQDCKMQLRIRQYKCLRVKCGPLFANCSSHVKHICGKDDHVHFLRGPFLRCYRTFVKRNNLSEHPELMHRDLQFWLGLMTIRTSPIQPGVSNSAHLATSSVALSVLWLVLLPIQFDRTKYYYYISSAWP